VELNGRTTAHDLGFGRMLNAAKDCVGKTLAARPALRAAGRLQLVALRSVSPKRPFNSGSLLVYRSRRPEPGAREGYVTSANFSPTLSCWIGLGLLREGHERSGEIIRAYDPIRDGDTELEVCHHPLFDPEGARLRA